MVSTSFGIGLQYARMEAWQILLIVIAVVLFVYLSGLFIVLTYAFEFTAKIKRRLSAINVILLEKRTIIMRAYEACLAKGVRFDDKFMDSLNQFQAYQLTKPRFEDAKNAISLQKFIQSRLFYEIQAHPELKKGDASMEQDITMLEDLDRNIRTSCSLFNADVLGYNYWINVPGFHWLFFILGRKNLTAII